MLVFSSKLLLINERPQDERRLAEQGGHGRELLGGAGPRARAGQTGRYLFYQTQNLRAQSQKCNTMHSTINNEE